MDNHLHDDAPCELLHIEFAAATRADAMLATPSIRQAAIPSRRPWIRSFTQSEKLTRGTVSQRHYWRVGTGLGNKVEAVMEATRVPCYSYLSEAESAGTTAYSSAFQPAGV